MSGRLGAFAALCFVVTLQIHRLDDSDTWWHLASGRRIAERGQVDRMDPFSFTAPGAEWVNRQWLFDLGAFETWRLGGDEGLILATGALYFAGFLALYRLVRRRLPAWAAAILVFLAAEAAVERFTVRPEAVTLCALAIELLLLDGAIGWGTVAALVALQVVWANLHALSVLGLVPLGAALVSAVAAEWLPLPEAWRAARRRPRAELPRLAVATAGAALAEAATPFGITGALYPLWLLTLIRGGELRSFTIIEHRATALSELSPVAATGLVALLALTALAALVSLRRWRLQHVLCAAAFVALALMARRNVALVGFGVLPLVASGLGPVVERIDGWLGERRPLRAAVELSLAALFVIPTVRIVTGTWYPSVARLTRTFGLGRSDLLFSRGAADWLERHAPNAVLFNDELLGGWLLWRSFPPRQVFLDGRLQVYPASVFADFLGVLNDPSQFSALAGRWGITAVILGHPAPGRLELASVIARMPGWRVGYLDAGAIVLVADGAPPAEPDGVRAPIVETDADGIVGPVEAALTHVRTPAEEALSHYHRGRAVAYLYGAAGAALAANDFRAALRLDPSLDDAAFALRTVGARR